MPKIVGMCIAPDLDDESDSRHRVEDPPGLVCYEQDDFIEEPAVGEATVDGLPVVVLQVIGDGDSFRSKPGGPIYTECRRTVKTIAGEGRICSFTGRPIQGPALECPCGCVVTAEVVKNPEMAFCPECRAELPQPERTGNE